MQIGLDFRTFCKKYFKLQNDKTTSDEYFIADNSSDEGDDAQQNNDTILRKDDPFFVEKCQNAEKELLRLKEQFQEKMVILIPRLRSLTKRGLFPFCKFYFCG